MIYSYSPFFVQSDTNVTKREADVTFAAYRRRRRRCQHRFVPISKLSSTYDITVIFGIQFAHYSIHTCIRYTLTALARTWPGLGLAEINYRTSKLKMRTKCTDYIGEFEERHEESLMIVDDEEISSIYIGQ